MFESFGFAPMRESYDSAHQIIESDINTYLIALCTGVLQNSKPTFKASVLRSTDADEPPKRSYRS